MKLLSLFVLVALLSTQSFARDTSSGCGLGWEVTDKKTLSATSTRNTTNATVPNTFGMTSGTLGCEQHGFVLENRAPEHYAEVNYEVIVAEMAQGQGETLSTFASLLGCDADMASKLSQSNYESIVKANGTPAQLITDFKQTACL